MRSELEDRFGPMPLQAQALMQVSALRLQARDLGVAAVVQKPSSLDIQFLANSPVQPGTVVELSKTWSQLRFRPGPPFTLQAEPAAFASQGPLGYLRDLFGYLGAGPAV